MHFRKVDVEKRDRRKKKGKINQTVFIVVIFPVLSQPRDMIELFIRN